MSEIDNFESFKDCLSSSVIAKLVPEPSSAPKKRKARKRRSTHNEVRNEGDGEAQEDGDVADLVEFIEYLAEEAFQALPQDLRNLSYASLHDDTELAETYTTPVDGGVVENIVKTLPPTISESLCTYHILIEASDVENFIASILNVYIPAVTTPPPAFTPAKTASRPPGCEICGREHLPLTYHHLIPRQVHAKAVKRGWHKEWELNKVAWLCRACHSYVHKVASNEQLARELYDVKLLLQREDVQRFAKWVDTIRWKAR